MKKKITFPAELPEDQFCDMVAVNGVPSWRNPMAKKVSFEAGRATFV